MDTPGTPYEADAADRQVNEHGYPDATPWRSMEPEQQVAYWRHQARKHEQRAEARSDRDQIRAQLDQALAEQQTDEQKATAEAVEEAVAAARAEERARASGALVVAEIRAAAAGKVSADRLEAVLGAVDRASLLTDGCVDTDKVTALVDALAPDQHTKTWPDTGQGRHPSSRTTGVAAGRDLFAERRTGKPS